MFWKFNLISTSHVETILSKENVTLEELMEEDDILQECKAQNKNLIDFLIRNEVMDEMIELIVKEPSDELEDRVRYKYPNIACELLTSDVSQINNVLAYDESLLIKLYRFLENEKPLNPLLASFFSKIVGILITRKTETILEFLKSKDNFVNLLLSHLSTSAIMDLLLRLVTCVENGKLRTEVLSWLNNQQIVQRLVALIDSDSDEEKHSNASQSLSDIVRFSREQMAQLQEKAEPDPLLQTLESTETVSKLLDHIFNGEKNESALVNGISVLLALLEFKKQGTNNQVPTTEQSSLYFRPESHEQMTALDAERMASGIKATLKALKPRLKDFHDLLKHPPRKTPIPTTIGILDEPLGNTRIHVARLITCIVSSNSLDINIDLAKLGTIDTLLDLFFKFTWNNFLHTQVEQCIGYILSNAPSESEDTDKPNPLLSQLLRDSCLIQRILDAWEDNEQQQAKPGGNRRGYMGHLTKIANHVLQNAEKGPCSDAITECLKDLPEDYKQKWEIFATTTLSEVNKKNQVSLVGGHPLQSSSEDDDADFRDIPFPQDTALQQAFSDYQMQQMTSNFIEQFGFNDDEFGDQEDNLNGPLERLSSVNFNISADENKHSEDLFEQVCSERIQPFDDADSDEDIWEDKVQDISFGNMPAQPNPHQPQRSNSDESTDSEEETDSKIRNTTDNIAALPHEEMKMDVDQNDPWTASFDSIPMEVAPVAMDLGNPWEQGTRSAQPNQDAIGWADFGSHFSSFSNAPVVGPTSVPVAMETSEANDTGLKYLSTANESSNMSQNTGISDSGLTSSSSLPDADKNASKQKDGKETPTSSACDSTTVTENLPGQTSKSEEMPNNFNFVTNISKCAREDRLDAVKSDVCENGPLLPSETEGEIHYNSQSLEEARCKDATVQNLATPTLNTTNSNGPV